jgi:hypothetical protein
MIRWAAARNWGARLHETTVRGMRAVVLENERLRATFLVDRGTDLVELNDKRRDLDFVWLSPAGPRPPGTGGSPDAVGDFLDGYPGGWQEVLPNGGAPARYRGAALAQHGEIARLPWDYAVTADAEDEVAVTFTVATPRLPVRLAKTVSLRSGAASLSFVETLVNEAPVPVEVMWGHHITFGRPFLRPGCRIRLPEGVTVIPHATAIHPSGARRVAPGGPYRWPVVPAASGGETDLSVAPSPGDPSDIVYLAGASWYEVVDPDRGAGLRVEWDAGVLPYLWLWQEMGATVEYPWWGRARVLGLEPFSSYPTDGLPEAVANGSALPVPGGGTVSLRLTASIVEETGNE